MEWWLAPAGVRDHLFPTCPALQRESQGNPIKGQGPLGDPYDISVCGWCQRVYRSREKATA